MFTGIIEAMGEITALETEADNLHIHVQSPIAGELKIDQSVSHNGVCLTVVELFEGGYVVTAIRETLEKSALGSLEVGDRVNLERAMKLGDRLDGHIVQGHVDQVGRCIAVSEADGSWYYTFAYEADLGNVTVEKGSITVNGVSLTVVNSKENQFSVAIIPYTYEHTNFNTFAPDTPVNLEFDVIGKYVRRLTNGYL